MTNTPISDEKTTQLIIKNAFKSVDSLCHFSKQLPLKSIIDWCYLCDEPYYIMTHWNTNNIHKTEQIRISKQQDIKGKSNEFYFKIPLISTRKQIQKHKHLFFQNSVSKFTRKDVKSKQIRVKPDLKRTMSNALAKRRYKQYKSSEILVNMEEILDLGMNVISECRITLNTRITVTASVKEILSLKTRFDQIDVNGNGKIDLGEFVEAFPDAFGGRHATRIFREMDVDKSGYIDFGELLNVLHPMTTHQDRQLILSWLKNNTINEEKIQILRGLHHGLNDYLRIEDITMVPTQEMFAILCVSQSFFPFTLHITNEQIFGDDKCPDKYSKNISMQQLIVMLFDKDYHESVPEMLKWIAPRKLTDKQRRDLKLLFEQYDTNNSGEINLEEFINACRRFGVSEEMGKTRFYSMDRDNTGTITFKEFTQFFQEVWDVGFSSSLAVNESLKKSKQ